MVHRAAVIAVLPLISFEICKTKYISKNYMHKGTYNVAKVSHNILIHVPKSIEKGKIHHRDNISQNGRKT